MVVEGAGVHRMCDELRVWLDLSVGGQEGITLAWAGASQAIRTATGQRLLQSHPIIHHKALRKLLRGRASPIA
jgi:hypothetical protein